MKRRAIVKDGVRHTKFATYEFEEREALKRQQILVNSLYGDMKVFITRDPKTKSFQFDVFTQAGIGNGVSMTQHQLSNEDYNSLDIAGFNNVPTQVVTPLPPQDAFMATSPAPNGLAVPR